jgi:hypothetical protein
MPLIRRRSQNRREPEFVLDRLSLQDLLSLVSATTGDTREHTTRIRTESDLRRAWEENREQMMTVTDSPFADPYEGCKPGQRPDCWWRFDAPSERLVIGLRPVIAPPWGVFRDGRRIPGGEIVEWLNYRESEACFLIRHGFVDDAERAMVAAANEVKRVHLRKATICNCNVHQSSREMLSLRPLDEPTDDQREAWRIEQELFREILD